MTIGFNEVYMNNKAILIGDNKTILPTTHRRLIFASGSPDPIDTQGGKARRYGNFRSIAHVGNTASFHYFFGWADEPVPAYSVYVGVERFRQEVVNDIAGLLEIRTAIELTYGVRFKNGNRGFYQSFLKHFTPAFFNDTCRRQHFRKQRRRKVDKPAVNLNPAMKCVAGKGDFAIFFVCKYKQAISVIEAVCRHANNRFSWQFIVHAQEGCPDDAKIQAGF